MPTFQTDLLYHARAIHQCVTPFEIEAKLDMETFKLRLQGRGRYVDMIPQFVLSNPLRFSPVLPDKNLIGFFGWAPYFNRRWPEATNKIPFKLLCERKNLPTPAYKEDVFPADADYLIKKTNSSFGRGIRGPFRSRGHTGRSEPLQEGEYREAFILGRIARAWYVNDHLACLELFDFPSIRGDGKKSISELLMSGMEAFLRAPQLNNVIDTLNYQGLTLDTVLSEDATAFADFRYGPRLTLPPFNNHNTLRRSPEQAVVRQFEAAGPHFWRAIPDALRAGTMQTVDAIVDLHGKAWFLEANCNSVIHPDVYPVILTELFGPPTEQSGSVTSTLETSQAAPPLAEGYVQPALSAVA